MTYDPEVERKERQVELVLRMGAASKMEFDWTEGANCQVTSLKDTDFIRKPDRFTARKWEKICEKCDVFKQCEKWAQTPDEFGRVPSGVFAAGSWRDDPDSPGNEDRLRDGGECDNLGVEWPGNVVQFRHYSRNQQRFVGPGDSPSAA